jgi:3-methyladenine DNA glycosylase AlkC
MDNDIKGSIESLEKEVADLEIMETQSKGLKDETPRNPRLEKAQDDGQKKIIPQRSKEKEEDDSSEDVGQENWKKRFGDLRRHSQKKDERIRELEQELSKKSNLPSPSMEEAEKWAKENPKAAEIIRALADEQVKPRLKEVDTIRSELQKDQDRIKIMKVHSDFEDIVANDAFHDWAESQPKRIQDLVYEGSAEEVVWAISMYKKEQEKPVNKDKEAAKQIKTKAVSQPTEETDDLIYESDVENMTLTEYAEKEAEIVKAQKAGRFVYDLSGGAR